MTTSRKPEALNRRSPASGGSAFLRVNYGINRKCGRFVSHRNGTMRIKGDWEDGETHEKIKVIIWRRHPGWLITGWCLHTPNDQALPRLPDSAATTEQKGNKL